MDTHIIYENEGFEAIYSKIPLLRPPKIKTNSPLKSIFKKCQ